MSDHVSGFQDMVPTLAAASGAKLTAETDGISLLPTLTGKAAEQKQHDYLYWNFDEQGGKRAVLQWPWKLIHLNTGAVRANPKANAKKPAGEVKALQVELYNLEADPGEDKNVAGENAAKVEALEKLIQGAWREPGA